jgi:ACT domain-containing protein
MDETGPEVSKVRAIITVICKDTIGIIARVTANLARNNVNILDISQSVLQEFFAMVMLVDLGKCPLPFAELQRELEEDGRAMGMSVRIQREDVFQAMHRI